MAQRFAGDLLVLVPALGFYLSPLTGIEADVQVGAANLKESEVSFPTTLY